MRKMIPVNDIREKVNRMLQTPDSTLYLKAPGKDRELTQAEALRMGVCSLLESILHETGNYKGFGYQDGMVTQLATKPGERTIVKDETRRIYY
jgi:hypothetical protein